MTDLKQTVAVLEQRLQASLVERDELLRQQAATAEILQVINSSPGDLTPVFNAILEKATLLCGASFGALSTYHGDDMHQVVATRGMPSEFANLFEGRPVRLGPETGMGRLVRGESFVHIADASDDEGYRLGNPVRRALVDIAEARTYLAVPLRTGEGMLGSFTIYRREVRLFSEKQIALLQNFAAQAVIAIENARLFNETKEALQQQTATAEVLQVISSSVADTAPVFEKILEGCERLFNGSQMIVFLLGDGEMLEIGAIRGPDPDRVERTRRLFPVPLTGTGTEQAIRERRLITFGDVLNDPDVAEGLRRTAAQMGETQSVAIAPMLREGRGIGSIVVSRFELRGFDAAEQRLLQTFADQAVIAIENARLFNETREALEQQKASADILGVISNSVADTQPVFDKILRSIEHLFGGEERIIFLTGEDGLLHIGAAHGTDLERLHAIFPVPLEGTASELAIRERRLVSYADVFNDPDVPPGLRQIARRRGENYAMAIAPMLWEDRAIGSIFVGRTSMKPFNEKERSLLQTFADQAVIAIQNARLFKAVQERTDDLSESLQQQTATAEVPLRGLKSLLIALQYHHKASEGRLPPKAGD